MVQRSRRVVGAPTPYDRRVNRQTPLAPSTRRSRRAAIPWVIAALSLAIAIAALYRPFSRRADGLGSTCHAGVHRLSKRLAGEPDALAGRTLPVAVRVSGAGQEGRRSLSAGWQTDEATWLAGTEHALPLAWSPDSRSLAVVANGEIKAVDIATGGIRTIGRAPDGRDALDAAWNGENILLGGPRLRRMSVADGHVTDVYRADPEVSLQYLPSFLPDGRRFLYSQESNNPARRGVFLGTLDSPQVTRLLPEPAWAIVSPRGYLLFGRQGTLFAQRFDLDHNRLAGDPVSIGSGLEFFGSFTQFAVSGDTLVWPTATYVPPARLTWFDRSGRKLNEIGDVRRYYQIALAPDGQRVVAGEVDTRSGSSLFLIELTRNIHARLTTGDQPESDPVWSPDSREVAFNCRGRCVQAENRSKRAHDATRVTSHGGGRLDPRWALRDFWAECAKRLGATARRRSKAYSRSLSPRRRWTSLMSLVMADGSRTAPTTPGNGKFTCSRL